MGVDHGSVAPFVVIFFPIGESPRSKVVTGILAASGFRVCPFANCDQGRHRKWWRRDVAPLEGPLIVHGREARANAERVRQLLRDWWVEPFRIAPMGSDPDPHRIYRPPAETDEEANLVYVFWPRWEPR